MSESEASPQILVNGEEQEQRQDKASTAEESISSSLSLDEDGLEDAAAAAAAGKDTPLKMQSVFQQVRKQIRSQASAKAPKSSILELVQKLKGRDAEGAQVSSEPEGKDVSGEEEKQAEGLTDEMSLTEEEKLGTIYQEKLEASQKALKEELQEQITQVRQEMQAYTDQALRDLESKMQSRQPNSLQQTHANDRQEGKAADRKQKPSVAPSMAARRGRVLTRTMTTIIPKTCAPVVVGPRAKSETLSSSKGENSRFLPRDPAPLPGTRPFRSCKPLPPAQPPLLQRKKSVQAKTKTGARLGLGDK